MAEWPAHHFLLYGQAPKSNLDKNGTKGATAGLEPMVSGKGATRTNGQFRDGQMDWIGAVYRASGFKPPKLSPIVKLPGNVSANDPDSRAYAVFLYDWSHSFRSGNDAKGETGGYLGFPSRNDDHCGPKVRDGWIAFNRRTATHHRGHDPAPKYVTFFDTLAHEMFHSVQAAYAFEKHCDTDYWISEGMTEGVAQWMFKRRFGYELGAKFATRSNQGVRPYQLPLYLSTYQNEDVWYRSGGMNETGKELGYGTASFWRFLIEAYGKLDFLHVLMSNRVGHRSWQNEIRWLDRGLGDAPGFHADRLYALYPEFITAYASWGGSKFPKVPASGAHGETILSSPEAAFRQWLKLGFKRCRQITVEAGKVATVRFLTVAPIAARCLDVKYKVPRGAYSGPDEIAPMIEALGTSEEDVDGIHLGIAREKGPTGTALCWRLQHGHYHPGTPRCVLKVNQFTPASGKIDSIWTAVRSWNDTLRLPQDGKTAVIDKIYIVSNVRLHPWKTKAVKISLHFGLPLTKTASGVAAGPPKGHAMPRPHSAKTAAKSGERHDSGDAQSSMEARARDLAAQMRRMARQMLSGKSGGMPPAIKYGIVPAGMVAMPSLTNLGTFSFRRKDGRRVTITPVPPHGSRELQFGQTGPLHATVTIEGGARQESSQLCSWGRDTRAGHVTESDVKRLVIKLDADICAMNADGSGCSQSGCAKADHVGATLYLPGGWRYYASLAPVSVVTPGMKDYIRRFASYSLSDFSSSPDGKALKATPSVSKGVVKYVGQSKGGGAGVSVSAVHCACTCDEFNKLMHQTLEGGNAASMSDAGICIKRCKSQYQACM